MNVNRIVLWVVGIVILGLAVWTLAPITLDFVEGLAG
jgi:hypothetical protein